MKTRRIKRAMGKGTAKQVLKERSERKEIHLKDYRVPDHMIPEIELTFDIYEEFTEVLSFMKVKKCLEGSSTRPLVLDGEKMELLYIKLDGRELKKDEDFTLTDKHLTIENVPSEFTLEVKTRIEPQNNTALEGLYVSGNIYCTQNEPEGFRKITYFLDRSDVMTRFTTKIIGNRAKQPVMLSNGNLIDQGDEVRRHFVVWKDPFPKPSYLFALVAGKLDVAEDRFVTRSGREVTLRIYVDPGNENKCEHALECLKQAMKWDEQTFGLEYDLDIYMIVAVEAFNFGAMENKGLNIFNAQYILAHPKTATDGDFEAIQAVIGHEYFHNWTGNRVTCRDWFQITLKEGLTVFRDQEFSADMTSRAVKRVHIARAMRDLQFVEDSGPHAHPIRPQSYIEVNNFYTTTVYQKGAEVIRMIETLIGKETFKKGITKYFELYDGQGVTTEDFVHAMEIVSGRDFTQFKNWYDQAGTPVCKVRTNYDAKKKAYQIRIQQVLPRTAAGKAKKPFHFPFVIGLLDKKGQDLPIAQPILEVRELEETFLIENVTEKPVPSLLRNFSAPVIVEYPYTEDELIFLMARDRDPFNRYDASRRLATGGLKKLIAAKRAKRPLKVDAGLLRAFGSFVTHEPEDPAFLAECLVLPSLVVLLEGTGICDFESVYAAKKFFMKTLAQKYRGGFLSIYRRFHSSSYANDQVSVARRTYKNRALAYLAVLDKREYWKLIYEQFRLADNMTDEITALALLCDSRVPEREDAIQAFYDKWKNDSIVMNKWFAVQASADHPDVLNRVKILEQNPAFDNKNPNKLRSLYNVFASNLVHYHHVSGDGYRFIADKVLGIDQFNPSAAAKLAHAFKKFSRLDPRRKKLMGREINRILSAPKLSRDVYEIISKIRSSAK